jgi:hypothetical protein
MGIGQEMYEDAMIDALVDEDEQRAVNEDFAYRTLMEMTRDAKSADDLKPVLMALINTMRGNILP